MDILFITVAWSIVIAFIVTLAITILGVTNVIKFANKKYLDRLFVAVILEVVAVGFLIFRTGSSDLSKYFQTIGTLYKAASEHKAAKRYDEALVDYKEILSVSNRSLPFKIEDVFLARGDIAFERELWPQAVESYAFYLELNKTNVTMMYKMGQALRKVHEYERAKQIYEMGYSLEPQNYEILNGLQNCLRRLGGFMDEGDKKEVANTYYEQARQHILSMINISKGTNEKRYKLASIALAKLSWQRQQYREGIAKYEEIAKEFPGFVTPREELAAIKLEYGSKTHNETLIYDSVVLYKALYLGSETGVDKVFNGAGLAEAVSRLKTASPEDMKIADEAVSLSIANNKSAKEEPYPLYATALLLKKQGKNEEAYHYISEAIKAETRRSTNPYTFDYIRLREYEKLKEVWDKEREGHKSSNISTQQTIHKSDVARLVAVR